MGASINVKATPYILKKGGVLLASKVLLAVVVGIIAGRFLGEPPISGGFLTGLSVLAIVAALNDTNGGMYMSLMGQYGRKPRTSAHIQRDEPGVRPVPDHGHPGRRGLVRASRGRPWSGAIMPLLLGMLLGDLDPAMRKFLTAASPGPDPVPRPGPRLRLDLPTVSARRAARHRAGTVRGGRRRRGAASGGQADRR